MNDRSLCGTPTLTFLSFMMTMSSCKDDVPPVAETQAVASPAAVPKAAPPENSLVEKGAAEPVAEAKAAETSPAEEMTAPI